jgi:hypothetical protein
MHNKPGRPRAQSSLAEQEMDRVDEQFKEFDSQVKEMTMDRMNAAPKKEVEGQTKLSQNELARSNDLYLKPYRTIGCREKFNENYRDEYNKAKEYVHFIAENREIIGEELDFWTRPFAGLPAEEWKVPCNKPLWAPRYVAEQIKRKYYHRLVMQQTPVNNDHAGQYYGTMAADTTIQRLDAIPVSSNRSVFMGAHGF